MDAKTIIALETIIVVKDLLDIGWTASHIATTLKIPESSVELYIRTIGKITNK